MKELTKKQEDVFIFCCEQIEKNDNFPTIELFTIPAIYPQLWKWSPIALNWSTGVQVCVIIENQIKFPLFEKRVHIPTN